VYSLDLIKPDGRALILYSRRPISPDIAATTPRGESVQPNPHLRWHPLRGEWVAYASYRQGRTFLPPAEYNPLAPTRDPENPTELPAGDYDIAVFDNRFPALAPGAHSPPDTIVPALPANGRCEVVVFAQDANASLGGLALDHIEILLEVWGARTRALGDRNEIEFVLPFENRGAEVGVTLHHPHGQIYAYPFVPPIPKRMNKQEREFFVERGTPLLQDLISHEVESGERLLYRGDYAVAFVPVCARYPYEVWVATVEAVESFCELDARQRADLARALKTTLLKYDAMWRRPLPYLLAWYQAPCDGAAHPESHLHAQFFPPYRTETKLKYLAGTELAAGTFANDALPEASARELQAVSVEL
jgi:UDPglucose--hexose-1-phosphate uridylyltransferase